MIKRLLHKLLIKLHLKRRSTLEQVAYDLNKHFPGLHIEIQDLSRKEKQDSDHA